MGAFLRHNCKTRVAISIVVVVGGGGDDDDDGGGGGVSTHPCRQNKYIYLLIDRRSLTDPEIQACPHDWHTRYK